VAVGAGRARCGGAAAGARARGGGGTACIMICRAAVRSGGRRSSA
jgi:hypothetical protein